MLKIWKFLVSSLIAAALAFSAPVALAASSNFMPSQVKSIEQIVHDYLIKNPQVLVEASQVLQQKEMAQAEQQAMAAIKQNKQDLFNNPNTPVIGNKNADVTLVEFFDYQCGHCKNMAPIIEKLLEANEDLKYVAKELPIFGANSKFAASAALASVKSGKYAEFHNALFATQNPLNKQKVLNVASKLGLNVNEISDGINNKAIQAQLRDNFKLAQALKLVGTPAFVLTNKSETKFRFIPGATSQANLQKQIDALK